MSVAKTIARAWADPRFREKLVRDPHAALAEHGVQVPEGKTVKVVENTEDTMHVVLPETPEKTGELHVDELEQVAGGLQACANNTFLS